MMKQMKIVPRISYYVTGGILTLLVTILGQKLFSFLLSMADTLAGFTVSVFALLCFLLWHVRVILFPVWKAMDETTPQTAKEVFALYGKEMFWKVALDYSFFRWFFTNQDNGLVNQTPEERMALIAKGIYLGMTTSMGIGLIWLSGDIRLDTSFGMHVQILMKIAFILLIIRYFGLVVFYHVAENKIPRRKRDSILFLPLEMINNVLEDIIMMATVLKNLTERTEKEQSEM